MQTTIEKGPGVATGRGLGWRAGWHRPAATGGGASPTGGATAGRGAERIRDMLSRNPAAFVRQQQQLDGE